MICDLDVLLASYLVLNIVPSLSIPSEALMPRVKVEVHIPRHL